MSRFRNTPLGTVLYYGLRVLVGFAAALFALDGQWVDAVSVTVTASGKFNATMRYFLPDWGERHEAPNKTDIVAYRHLRGANVLFHDGHAQWLPATELRYDPADKTTTVNKRQWEPKTP